MILDDIDSGVGELHTLFGFFIWPHVALKSNEAVKPLTLVSAMKDSEATAVNMIVGMSMTKAMKML